MKCKVWLLVVLLVLLPVWGSAQEGVCVDYELIYRDVLDDFCGLITEGEELYWEVEGAVGVIEIIEFMETEDQLTGVGYYIADVNGDGVKELLIGEAGEESDGRICAVYTCVDGVPVCAAEGWARSRYYLMEDGSFLYEGSAGAAATAFGKCVLADGQMKWEVFYFTDFAPGSTEQINQYRNDVGAWDTAVSEQTDEKTFGDTWDELSWMVEPLNYTSMAEYVNRPTVRAAWGEDVLSDGTAYRAYAADRSEFESTVVFLADERVTDFKLLNIEYADMNENGEILFDVQEVYRLDELTQEYPFAVITTFYGDVSQMGVSYVDADGTEKVFEVYVSGYDGSLQMNAIQTTR